MHYSARLPSLISKHRCDSLHGPIKSEELFMLLIWSVFGVPFAFHLFTLPRVFIFSPCSHVFETCHIRRLKATSMCFKMASYNPVCNLKVFTSIAVLWWPSLRPSSLCHCSPTTAIITVDFYTLWYKFRSLFRRLPLMYVGYSYRRKFVQPYELVCFYYKPWCSHGHTFWRMANSSRMSCATSLHPSIEIRCITWCPLWYNARRNNWLCVMRVFSYCTCCPFHLLWQEH